MPQIDTKGMNVASLSEHQLQNLLNAEKDINSGNKNGEVYLLAVTRKG